jgi:type II secretory pathway pseudopilin PulG
MKRQRGLSLIGLIIVAAVVSFVAIIGFKLLPSYIEYFTIQRVVRDISRSPELRGGTIKDVQYAFDKRATIDNITSLKGEDLEVNKAGEGFEVVASYSVKVPLFGNLSACIDFETRN